MSRPAHRTAGTPALELFEEAVHLLRGASAGVFLQYYLGTLPFALALLWFWADMSRGAFAETRCAAGALALMALFLWMKCWQSVFAASLRAQLTGAEPPRWTLRRVAKVAFLHAALQSSGLLLLPVAFVVTIPFPVAFMFYQNLLLLADGETLQLRQSLRRAAGEAARWPTQGWTLKAIFLLFGLVTFVNICFGLQLGPFLLKVFFGIETPFTRSANWSVLNTTFFATAAVLTWLCLDPLVKAVYLLRCFYGLSLLDGEDLKVEISRARLARSLTAAVALLLLASGSGLAARAAAAPTPPATVESAPAVPPAELNRAIERILTQPEFVWRQPRERAPAGELGWLRKFIQQAADAITNWLKDVRDVFLKVLFWLREFFDRWFASKPSSRESGGDWQGGAQTLVFVLLAVTLSVLAVLLFRLYRNRRRTPAVVAQAVAVQPDVADENVTADQLPEDDWLKLARELAARGDLRLALRAMYLASLAHLGQRELVVIARFKSNRDYELELRRRARAWPELQAAFAENVGAFDRVWYGLHEITPDGVQQFEGNVQRIRATGRPTP